MKKLIIVRHAKSSWDSPSVNDHDRPLNGRGKKNAPEMGGRLLRRSIRPDVIISSSAKRAFSTAKKIAKEIAFPIADIRKEPAFYHGSTSDIIGIIQQVGDQEDCVMIFGHNPGFTDLANFLSGADIYNIPTCGIVEIDFDVLRWSKAGKDSGKLVSFDYPKKLSSNA